MHLGGGEEVGAEGATPTAVWLLHVWMTPQAPSYGDMQGTGNG